MIFSTLPVITAYNKPTQLLAAINGLSSSYDRMIVLDNSTDRSVADVVSMSRKAEVEYYRTGIDIGFDRSLATGLRRMCKEAGIGDFFCWQAMMTIIVKLLKQEFAGA